MIQQTNTLLQKKDIDYLINYKTQSEEYNEARQLLELQLKIKIKQHFSESKYDIYRIQNIQSHQQYLVIIATPSTKWQNIFQLQHHNLLKLTQQHKVGYFPFQRKIYVMEEFHQIKFKEKAKQVEFKTNLNEFIRFAIQSLKQAINLLKYLYSKNIFPLNLSVDDIYWNQGKIILLPTSLQLYQTKPNKNGTQADRQKQLLELFGQLFCSILFQEDEKIKYNIKHIQTNHSQLYDKLNYKIKQFIFKIISTFQQLYFTVDSILNDEVFSINVDNLTNYRIQHSQYPIYLVANSNNSSSSSNHSSLIQSFDIQEKVQFQKQKQRLRLRVGLMLRQLNQLSEQQQTQFLKPEQKEEQLRINKQRYQSDQYPNQLKQLFLQQDKWTLILNRIIKCKNIFSQNSAQVKQIKYLICVNAINLLIKVHAKCFNICQLIKTRPQYKKRKQGAIYQFKLFYGQELQIKNLISQFVQYLEDSGRQFKNSPFFKWTVISTDKKLLDRKNYQQFINDKKFDNEMMIKQLGQKISRRINRTKQLACNNKSGRYYTNLISHFKNITQLTLEKLNNKSFYEYKQILLM